MQTCDAFKIELEELNTHLVPNALAAEEIHYTGHPATINLTWAWAVVDLLKPRHKRLQGKCNTSQFERVQVACIAHITSVQPPMVLPRLACPYARQQPYIVDELRGRTVVADKVLDTCRRLSPFAVLIAPPHIHDFRWRPLMRMRAVKRGL